MSTTSGCGERLPSGGGQLSAENRRVGFVARNQAGAGYAVQRNGGGCTVDPRLGGPRLPCVDRRFTLIVRERQVLAESKNKVTDKSRGVGAAAGKGQGAQSGKPAKGGGKDKDGVRRPQTPTKRRSRSPARPAAPAKGSGKGESKWSGQWADHSWGGRGARR